MEESHFLNARQSKEKDVAEEEDDMCALLTIATCVCVCVGVSVCLCLCLCLCVYICSTCECVCQPAASCFLLGMCRIASARQPARRSNGNSRSNNSSRNSSNSPVVVLASPPNDARSDWRVPVARQPTSLFSTRITSHDLSLFLPQCFTFISGSKFEIFATWNRRNSRHSSIYQSSL